MVKNIPPTDGKTPKQPKKAPIAKPPEEEKLDVFKALGAQLKNQDPLNPVSSGEVMQTLIGEKSLEQQQATTKSIRELTNLIKNTRLQDAAALIGKTVFYNTDTISVPGGKRSLRFDMPDGIKDAKAIVYNSKGEKVYSKELDMSKKPKRFKWNYENIKGNTPQGQYTVKIIAHDEKSNETDIKTYRKGKIISVIPQDLDMLLEVNGKEKILSEQIFKITS